MNLTKEQLFWKLYQAPQEEAVDEVIESNPELFAQQNWHPYGGTEKNFGVVENQQSSPIPALVEKLTNSIDAILMRRCYENQISPKSEEAPASIEEAIARFFPNARDWDLSSYRQQQAEEIQIIADGPKLTPSLVVYDNGEGQHPSAFENTFLSLLRGSNKNEIHFVQGKYNMGGAGAVVFCGSSRYQLIGSKRFDGTGPFGFTLLRRHPLTERERARQDNTWYEYLKIGGAIPSFEIDALDLGLHNRTFETGSVIKLYSYNLPSGSRSVISRDLNQSLNEFLFQPALPVYTIDTEERYPKDKNLERDLYGLKRRLERQKDKYLETIFSEEYTDGEVGGTAKVTCYVFKPRIDGKSVSETKKTIRQEFFKNNMSVLFSVNGQVHGHYTTEFISRSLKFTLLKSHLLIHVDCTDLDIEFRNELFMASRDRLKKGEESRTLRHALARVLRNSRLKDIYKHRRNAITVESSDSQDLVKNFAKNLPMDKNLTRLLNQTLDLNAKKDGSNKKRKQKKRSRQNDAEDEESSFTSNRFPSSFRLDSGSKTEEGIPLVKTPLGGNRTLKFSSDVEDEYFDRISEPGELELSILDYSPNETDGGDAPGLPDRADHVFNIVKASPDQGTIRVTVSPKEATSVGDAIKMKASLTAPGGDLEQVFWIKITRPRKRSSKPRKKKLEESSLGLPELSLVYRSKDDGQPTWDDVESSGTEMDHSTVMHPDTQSDRLDRILINMNSRVLMNYKSHQKGEKAIELAEKRYISSVYFHTLFLYMIARSRGYSFFRQREQEEDIGRGEDVDLTDYLKDLFESYYSEFLLNFETSDLIASLEE